MLVLIGLLALIAALVVGVAAVVANVGNAHLLSTDFTVFNQHFTGSQGQLFAAGAVVGAVGMFGLALLLAGALSASRRHAQVRRELRQQRREMSAAKKDLASTSRDRQASAQQQPVWSWNRFLRRPSGSRPSRSAQPQA
ncbi:hypothetical protein [Nocardia transvalensis]|uniref:hypothetical protein n=1 Tax=Nocardia transvalensis TaxID=37333 RepID=UPI00189415DF|nr:hypothetical protein [Nocardia transvalensis]MBF6327761.1 hypothetical protein [Nocardia transvalensis]